MTETDPRSTAASRELFVARLSVLVAALLWSASGFFAKAPLLAGWPGPRLVFWRAVFAAIVLWPFVRRPRWDWRLVPLAIAFAVMNFTFLEAMVHTTSANTIWLQQTGTIWVFLVGVLAFREPARPLDWMMLAFGAAGIGLILGFESQGESFYGVANGFLSSFCFAAVVLSLRWLRDEDPVWLAAVNLSFTAIVFLPLLWLPAGEGAVETAASIWPSGWQWLLLVGFGALQMGLPYVMFARGLRVIPSHEAAFLSLIEPILTPLWVFVAWSNWPGYTPPAWWTLAGAACILVGLAARYGGAWLRTKQA